MKASDDMLSKIRIKEVTKLGNEKSNEKLPPVLVRFGHPTERNQILPLSRNLKRDFSIDKFVPKMYLHKHREFKRHAWKLKSLFNIQAQVVFDGHNLVVRYKRKDDGDTKFNWTIAKEYHPRPEDAVQLSRVESRDPTKHDTPIIDMSCSATCNRSVIVTGCSEKVTPNNVKAELLSHISDTDHLHIEEIEWKSKGTVCIICKDWKSCKYILDTYNKSKMSNKELFFTMFAENDPNK